jgi:3-hydroxyisobutyrate dehydrogenase
MTKVAYIGLGVMGSHMAGHLVAHGYDVTVYNRTASKAEAWLSKHDGKAASSPREAAADADFVFACVRDDDDLREVTIGADGAFRAMKQGAVFVDNTTASSGVARQLNTAALQREVAFLDAPVSGGEAGAVNGVLTVMVGGDEESYFKAEPLLKSYARMCKLIGPSGSGQIAKMVNQICAAGIIQALAEGLHFARKAGVDPDAVIDSISKGAAQSWIMENRSDTMLKGEFNFGFAVNLFRKDLDICLRTADEIGAQLPITRLINEFYLDVQKMGGGRWDATSLIARLEQER